MFQQLVKISLLFCLLVCASADSNEAGVKKLFARQLNGPIILPGAKSKPSPKDYENLYTAIATEFAPSRNMAIFLRLSLYSLFISEVSSNGCYETGYTYSFPILKDLENFVKTKFDLLDFESRGNINYAASSCLLFVRRL